MSDLLVGVLFAAYHAISMSLNGALWEIGTNEQLQCQLRREFNGTSQILLTELNKLPRLNNFVMEILRHDL
jgi:cytochrome P450